ncbi:hypothetical protein AB6A40_008539 [Gnathostoma spinigerum]|uniref:Uncharacterized protein n=1 Tax=Gnathostoma spinigerum TaxID=75299 RepID=A0ABD6EPC8_9BILA
MRFQLSMLLSVYIVIVHLVVTNCSQLHVPAGLRPAKAIGNQPEVIIPEQSRSENNVDTHTPTNLVLRSRTMATLKAPSNDALLLSKNSPTHEPQPPIIFTKSPKKKQSHVTKSMVDTSKKARIVVIPPVSFQFRLLYLVIRPNIVSQTQKWHTAYSL